MKQGSQRPVVDARCHAPRQSRRRGFARRAQVRCLRTRAVRRERQRAKVEGVLFWRGRRGPLGP
eukprot:1932871-Lingulodinium_polyedra.AAC.1